MTTGKREVVQAQTASERRPDEAGLDYVESDMHELGREASTPKTEAESLKLLSRVLSKRGMTSAFGIRLG